MAFPTDLLARFEEPTEIGSGGMGRVYRATEKSTLRAVAVKVIDAALCEDAEMRARFLDEVRLARRVQHANVVRVMDSGRTAGGQLFMVTELVDGATLKRILERESRLPPPKVIGMGRALLGGLAAIHEADIVHRDLKPANILIDRAGTLKIIDFGIARDTAEKLTRSRTGMLLGTPHYFAPEQADSGAIGPATDVYAAGAILYEALAGRPPFPGDDFIAALSARLTSDPAPLDTLVPDVPRALIRVVHRMLSRDAADRYANGREALSALKVASGDRGETVRRLESAGATAAGDSMVPPRLTGQKIPLGAMRPEAPTPPPARPLPVLAPRRSPAGTGPVADEPGPRLDRTPPGPGAPPRAAPGPRPAPAPRAAPANKAAPVPGTTAAPAAVPAPTPPQQGAAPGSGVVGEDGSGDASEVPAAAPSLIAGMDPGRIAIAVSVALIGVVTLIALLIRLLQ